MPGSIATELTVGYWPDSGYPATLPVELHREPIYALGLPGTGKSTLLGNLALQWSRMGDGVVIIDVKDGQLARDVAMRADADKLIYVAPGTTLFDGRAHHWGLNVVELPDRDRNTISGVVDNVMSMLERLDRADYTQMTLLRTKLDSAVRLALYAPKPNLRLVRQLLTDEPLRKQYRARYHDALNEEVEDEFRRMDDPKSNSPYGKANSITSTVNRLKELLTPPELAYMLIQDRSTMRFKEWLEAGKLVCVDCVSTPADKANLANRVSELMGNLILTQLMHFTFGRKLDPIRDPWEGRTRAVRLICDEFDKLAGNNFADLITKARAYRVFPVMAHQNKDQLRADRDKAQTLYNAASGVPVEFEFTLTDEDRRRVEQLHPGDEPEEAEQWTARLRLRKRSLPYGLLDRGHSALIGLYDWRTDVIDGQLEAAIAAQRPHTTPESQLREPMRGAHHAADPLADFSRTPEPKPAKARQQKPSPRQERPVEPASAGSVPIADRAAARPAHLPAPDLD